MMTLVHEDERTGDVYEVFFDASGFDSCQRTMEKYWRKPLSYNNLSEIPNPQRDAIEHKIWIALNRK